MLHLWRMDARAALRLEQRGESWGRSPVSVRHGSTIGVPTDNVRLPSRRDRLAEHGAHFQVRAAMSDPESAGTDAQR